MDALSDLLRVVRLTGSVFLTAELSAPWCIAVESAALRSAFRLGSDHLVLYHLVTDGGCWARLDVGEPIYFGAGDLMVLAHDSPHVMGSSLECPPVPVTHRFASPPEMLRLQYGGGGELTRIVCGFLSCDRQLVSPLLGALPPLFRVHAGDGAAAAWITSSLAFTLAEETAAVAGSSHTLAKLSELMFAEAIKLYLRSLPPQESGWLAGLRDRFVGRALALMHSDPARQWSVEELGRAVGLSRSAFAQRFTDFLGEPPMRYLSGWRLRIAAQILSSDKQRVGAVAETVGYDSEAAFNRAFKRQFGMPPSMWRRNAQEPRDRRAQRKPARSSV